MDSGTDGLRLLPLQDHIVGCSFVPGTVACSTCHWERLRGGVRMSAPVPPAPHEWVPPPPRLPARPPPHHPSSITNDAGTLVSAAFTTCDWDPIDSAALRFHPALPPPLPCACVTCSSVS